MPPNDAWLHKEMALQPLLFGRVLPVKNFEIFRKVLVSLLLLSVYMFSKYYNNVQHFL